jgi:hypothetical protein
MKKSRATVAVRRGQTILESDRRRRLEFHVAPPKQAERRHSRPGSGWKRSRANMLPRPT